MCERTIPRAVVALSLLAAAAVTDPRAVGIYSWAVLATSLYGAVTDSPIRHVAAVHILTPAGPKLLGRYALIAGVSGLMFMLTAVWTIARFAFTGSTAAGVALLLPLVLIPPAQAIAVQPVARLQREGHWAQLSLSRMIASLVGAVVGVPIVFLSRSILGASLALMLAELLFALCAWVFARHLDKNFVNSDRCDQPEGAFWSTYWHMTGYSTLGWLQSQSERVFLGLWAGTTALGSYSLGSAIGRSAADAINESQAGVLRVDLSNAASRADVMTDEMLRPIVKRNLRAAVLLAAAGAVGVALVTDYGLAPWLGAQWIEALTMVPILALTGVPLAVAASSAPVHIQRGNSRVAYLGPAICLIFVPVIAAAAVASLVMAAWVVLIKDCVLAFIQAVLMGRATPWSEVVFAGFIVGLGSVAVLLIGI